MSYQNFKIISVLSEGKYRRVQEAICCRCGATERMNDAANHMPIPPEPMGAKFRRKGWVIASRRTSDVCPSCAAAAAPAPAPTAVQPSLTLVPQEPVMTIAPLVADPPRQASPADRRRLLDEMTIRWASKAQCYVEDWSDATLASLLDVPRAWVTEMREMMFGAEDTNEAAQKSLAELPELEKRCRQATDEAMALAARFEALGKEVAAVMSALHRPARKVA